MSELVRFLATLLGFAIPVFAACWVWQDANRLKKSGAYMTPGLWAALVFFFWLIGLPVYLYLRRTTWQTSVSPPPTTEVADPNAVQRPFSRPSGTELRVLYWMVSLMFAVALSMYATWFAISRYPVPDSNALNLGLFLFFLIGLVTLLIIGDLKLFGKHIGIVEAVGIFVGGFLIAAVVGSVTWGIGWFIADRPWVPRYFYVAFAILSALHAWWLRRKSRTPSDPSTSGTIDR
jgi:hypothetical protein